MYHMRCRMLAALLSWPLCLAQTRTATRNVVIVAGIPGAGKTTIVRTFIDRTSDLLDWVAEDGACSHLQSRDQSVAVLGRWSGYHADDPPCTTLACRSGQLPGDGTDRLMTSTVHDHRADLLDACTHAISVNTFRLVIAEGLFAEPGLPFAAAAESLGYRTRIRELKVSPQAAEQRRALRDGRSVRWDCDLECQEQWDELRSDARWGWVTDHELLDEMFNHFSSAVKSAPLRPIAPPPPPIGLALGAPPPPPPALVAGLRGLLRDVPGCHAACVERAEDWFEQAVRWGATSVESMVRLQLADHFLSSLSLIEEGETVVSRRLSKVGTTLAPRHDEI